MSLISMLTQISATLATAQQRYGPPSDSDDGGYSSSYDDGSYGSPGNSFGGGSFDSIRDQVFTRYNAIIVAHAVLATAAFGLLFPLGGILIRLGNFPRLWLIHGIFQMVAYLLYIVAFGLGVYMFKNARLEDDKHPIIGIFVFLLILLQPVFGWLHHAAFKKHGKRGIWSHTHVWIGRIAITLGIVNGGLGLELSQQTRIFEPSQGAIIGYAVGAGVMWLIYVASAVYGERKRSRQAALHQNAPPSYPLKDQRDSDNSRERPVQYA